METINFHKCFAHLRRSVDPTASIVNTFSTMLLIHFSKLVFIASLSVFSTKVYHLPHRQHYLYFDSSILFFSKQHIPYLILSVVAFLFVIIFSLLLSVYPTKIFRRLLEFSLPLQWRLAICALVETFQGHYKDGTNGTKDYRAISVLQFCLQFIVIVGYTSGNFRFYFIESLQISLLLISLLYTFIRPCKRKSDNFIMCLLYSLTAFLVQMIFIGSFYTLLIMLTLLFIPHCLFVVLNLMKYSCSRKPFVYLRTMWSKRKNKSEHQNEDQNSAVCVTEQTRLLANI